MQSDGSIANGRLFAERIGDGDLAKGGLVDGMKFDEQGNIWVTGPDGVWVFAPDGEHLGVIEMPGERRQRHTGAAPDWNWLFVPASTSAVPVRDEGRPGGASRYMQLGGDMADFTLDPKRTALIIQDLQNDVIIDGRRVRRVRLAGAREGAERRRERRSGSRTRAGRRACP